MASSLSLVQICKMSSPLPDAQSRDMAGVDLSRLAAALIRGLRGKRSQTAFSRRIKSRSNVVYTWESGRRFPAAHRFFEVAELAGVDLAAALTRFFRTRPAWLATTALKDREGVVRFLGELKGARTVAELSRATGKSRFQIARWLAGETEPRLPDLLLFVHGATYRLLDFVAAWVEPAAVPVVAAPWQQLTAARRAAYTKPWCHAVLRLIETPRANGGQWDPESLARTLGISESEAASSLELLEESGQIERTPNGLRVSQLTNVDLAEDPEAVVRLKAWAAGIGLERIRSGAPGTFSYNLFCVSERDYVRLQQLQRDYFRQLRAIVAESEPSQRVVMTNLQLFPLDVLADTAL